jgi:hypothetical protein
MSLSSRSVTTLVLILSLACLAACQGKGNVRQEGLDNAEFMDAWQTYTRCISSSDLNTTQLDSLRLRTISQVETGSPPFKAHVTNSRLAVDLRAMSASCTLHAGDIAAISGRDDTARDMFNAVLDEYSAPLYAYYAEQARARLVRLGTGLQASLPQF